MSHFTRPLLSGEAESQTATLLQGCLVDLIDLALQMKQAHWNVVGPHFQPIHEKLDEVVETAREASDEVAERIVAIGVTADGRAATLVESSRLDAFPAGFHDGPTIVTACSDRLSKTCVGLREAIAPLGDLDPISEDLLIGITAELEKHLWMLQAQEK